MEDDVPDSAEVKAVRVSGQLNPPPADGTCPLEGQVALVAKVELEEPAVLAPRARHDRLRNADVCVEMVVIAVVRGDRVLANTAEGLGEGAVYARIRPHDTRNRECNRLDSPHVVSRVIHVEQPLWNVHFAFADLLQGNEGGGVQLRQR